MGKKLKFGETPWDKLTREELLREVQRMYAAITSLDGALALCRHHDPHSPFWSDSTDAPPPGREHEHRGGTGGNALEQARSILVPLHALWDPESIYRAFFRYAVDLLFTPALGFEWYACDHCPHLHGGADLAGKNCPHCEQIEGKLHRLHRLRRLEWKDLTPPAS